MRNIFNLSVIATFLLIGFSVFYYFVIFLPEKERGRVEQVRQEGLNKEIQKREQETKLDTCFNQAYEAYIARWNGICKIDGLEEKCKLPADRSEPTQIYYKELKDECFRKYPQQ